MKYVLVLSIVCSLCGCLVVKVAPTAFSVCEVQALIESPDIEIVSIRRIPSPESMKDLYTFWEIKLKKGQKKGTFNIAADGGTPNAIAKVINRQQIAMFNEN